LIGPDGTVLSDYSKHNAIFGIELIETDDSPLTIVDTPYGKIALVICFDMDHHEMPFQAREADIVFDVSNDWIALDPFHTQMAAVNGIANGYSVVRPTGRGLSMASDFRGNVLGTTDVYPFDADGDAIPEDWVQNSGTIMIANVPTVGTTTVYSVVGDLFGFACVMGLILLALYGVFGKRLKIPIKFADSGSRDE
jgi:apolipoprotein N-acyltransferase